MLLGNTLSYGQNTLEEGTWNFVFNHAGASNTWLCSYLGKKKSHTTDIDGIKGKTKYSYL